MKRILGLAVLLLAGFFVLASCSNPLGGANSTVSQTQPTTSNSTVAPANGSDFANSSVQNAPTLGGKFILSGALGETTSDVQSVTPRGYILFSNIQGQFISNQESL